MNRTPLVIAHRGASRAAPENTVDAFHRARALGADWVELDVRLAADGSLVVHHDERYADGRLVGTVAGPDRPPTVPDLDAALVACRGMGVNIEIKNIPGEAAYDPAAAIVGAVAAAIDRASVAHDLLISCFDPATIAAVRTVAPDLATALLTFGLVDPLAAVAEIAAAGHEAIHPFDGTVDAELVQHAHGAGLRVNVWTVDDPQRMVELAGFGVDGICTNVPDVARTALRNGRATE